MKYRHPNSGIIFRRIKLAMKDEERGAMGRESLAACLRMYAAQLEEVVPETDQLELLDLDDLPERIQEHLKKNRK